MLEAGTSDAVVVVSTTVVSEEISVEVSVNVPVLVDGTSGAGVVDGGGAAGSLELGTPGIGVGSVVAGVHVTVSDVAGGVPGVLTEPGSLAGGVAGGVAGVVAGGGLATVGGGPSTGGVGEATGGMHVVRVTVTGSGDVSHIPEIELGLLLTVASEQLVLDTFDDVCRHVTVCAGC